MDNVTQLPTIRKINLPTPPNDRITPQNFFERGLLYIQANCEPGKVPTAALGTAECDAWARYFRNHLGWEPWMLTAVERHNIPSMTLPTQWPEWFDTSWTGS